MENPPFEDVFPIQDGDLPASYVCLPEGMFLGRVVCNNFLFFLSQASQAELAFLKGFEVGLFFGKGFFGRNLRGNVFFYFRRHVFLGRHVFFF